MQPDRRSALRGRIRALTAALTGAALVGAVLSAAPAALADQAPAAAPAANTAASGLPATVSADPLPTVQINGVVWDQAIVGNTVYAVGSFTSARPAGSPPGQNETARSNILAYDIRTGALISSFAPKLNAQARTVTASPDGSTIYVGGNFTNVDGKRADRIAAFSTSTGQQITSFAPSVNSAVYSIAVTSSAVYVGGPFNSAGGKARSGLAAFTPAGGLLSWAPAVGDGRIAALLVSPDQSRVILGGTFSRINGSEAYGSAAVDPKTGASMPWALNAVVRNGGADPATGATLGGITSLSTDGKSIFGSAYNYGANSLPFLEGTFAADPTTGAAKWINDCNGDTYSTSPVDGVLYTVGHAHNCSAAGWFDNAEDSSGRLVHWNSLAFTTAASGRNNVSSDQYGKDFTAYQTADILPWFPQWQVGTFTGQYQAGWSVKSNSQYVVVGGEFPVVGGVAQQGLVRFAVRGLAPNKVKPQPFTTPPVVSVATNGGQLTVTASSGTWDPDDATLTYTLVRDAGKPSEKVLGSQSASSTFWQQSPLNLTDTAPPLGEQHTYSVRAVDPWGNAVSSRPVSVSTGSWSSVTGQTSTAYTQYVATVGTASLLGRTLTVPFSAKGPSDLRRPDSTCLSDGTNTVSPSAVSLTTDAAGSFAGTLTYQLPGAGSYTLQYSCSGDYSRASVGAWDGSTGQFDPSVSQAYDGTYTARVGKVVQDGSTVTVPFTAFGPADLRRPEDTCISNGSRTVRPTSSSLTTDRAGSYAGTLVYTLPENGTYTLQYACFDVYSKAQLGSFTGVTKAFTPVASTAVNGQYVATVQNVRQVGNDLTVTFSATGPGDLRRPEGTCISNGSTTVAPKSSALTTDRAGAFAGTLTYTLPQSGSYTLQYACFDMYTQAPIGSFTATRTTPVWSAVTGGASKAFDDYVVTVGTSTVSGTTLSVPFTANGPADLRRPDSTCIASGGTQLRPTGVSLTTDEPGRKVGTLTYQLSTPGTFSLQYSCEGPYNFTEIGTYAP